MCWAQTWPLTLLPALKGRIIMNAENSGGVLTTARPRGLRGRQLLAIGGLVLLAVLAVLAFLGMSSMSNANTPPPGLDTSRTQTSAKGLYRATFVPGIEPIAIN